jgi:hypothetical protein
MIASAYRRAYSLAAAASLLRGDLVEGQAGALDLAVAGCGRAGRDGGTSVPPSPQTSASVRGGVLEHPLGGGEQALVMDPQREVGERPTEVGRTDAHDARWPRG